MTREEAIKHLHDDWCSTPDGELHVEKDKKDDFLVAIGYAITTLQLQEVTNCSTTSP